MDKPVEHGISKLSFFTWDIDKDGKILYSKTSLLNGVVSIELTPETTSKDIIIDGVVVETVYKIIKYTGTLTLLQVDNGNNLKFKNHALGYHKNDNGVIVKDNSRGHFGIQIVTTNTDDNGYDQNKVMTLYNLVAGDYSISHKTDDNNVTVVNYNIPITATPNIYVKDKISDSIIISTIDVTDNNVSINDNINNGDVIHPNIIVPDQDFNKIGNIVIGIDQIR